MKKLSQLLPDYAFDEDLSIKGIKTNSGEIEPGDLFLCVKGANVDRHDYIPDAIAKGAVFLITAKDVDVAVPYLKVEDPEGLLDELYRRFYDDPQDKLKLIAVTGTDGKTTTTTIIQTLIGADKCGYIGTNGYSCAAFNRHGNNTTPSKDKLYQYLAEFVETGCQYVAMEASSEGFYYHRLDGFQFACGIFTNITSEHLNTHKTLENYIACKKQLLKQITKEGYAILNGDDDHFKDVYKDAIRPLIYGRDQDDDLWIAKEEYHSDHSDLKLVYQGKEYALRSPLMGAYNAENLAGAILGLLSMGFKMEELLLKLPQLKVSGRMAKIDEGQNFQCIVDYAHTPNGLKRMFEFVKGIPHRHIITVIGQAGERDAYKRHDVGRIVAENSDLAIFTYEDPRHEDINEIIKMMISDIQDRDNYLIVHDRHDAIFKAISSAKKDDIVLILGKGNEDYELIKGEVVSFNDITEAIKAIKEINK